MNPSAAARTLSTCLCLAAPGALLCSPKASADPTPPSTSTTPSEPPPPTTLTQTSACAAGRRMTVHFYDVGQALAALVDLPDGKRVLVDTGDSPRRPDCGDACAAAHQHLLQKLRADLHGRRIDLLWITHQHSDHIGGAPEVLEELPVASYVDNGRDARKSEVRRAHEAARGRGTAVHVVDPEHLDPTISDAPGVKLTPIVPLAWPAACSRDPNDCSIALRIDFCSSSILFTGDAEHAEEAALDPHGAVTLLQVGHHGSETSSTPAFLTKVHPSYAVISAGKPNAGPNVDYCHPRALVVKRLTFLLGGPGQRTLAAFDGDRCATAQPSDWIDVPASDRLWATERDGDVVLTTAGDGTFVRQ